MVSRNSQPPPATLAHIVDQVRAAAADRRSLNIVGGGSKRFLARELTGELLSVSPHQGIVAYEPTELVITAKAGTPLAEINAVLASGKQMLGFEPPQLSATSTIGGVVSCGISGPGRPYRGSVRDHVLGVELINGKAELLRFGGQVMKNVAGYDVSRLVAAAYGTLGVITEISLRVLPRPERETTLLWNREQAAAHRQMLDFARHPWPITAMAAGAGQLRVRVSGSAEAVDDVTAKLAPERVNEDDSFWRSLRDMTAADLTIEGDSSVWRLSLPPAAPDPAVPVALHDWGGAQRWLKMHGDGARLRAYCAEHNGHATCVRRARNDPAAVFTRPTAALQALMLRVRKAFDPVGIFNPGHYFDWM